jgi:hypothetical protein
MGVVNLTEVIGSFRLFGDFLGLKLHLSEDFRPRNLQKGAIEI